MAGRNVTVYEVGPRDGLQNESAPISFADKLFLIRGLVSAGIRELEVGAFVRPDRVPRMADTPRLIKNIQDGKLDLGKARAWSLVPNRRGFENALEAGVRQIAVFTAATESFARRNIGMSISESLREFAEIVQEAKRLRIPVRGYVSTAFGCPFEGRVRSRQALTVFEQLLKLGVQQVSLGDTIGVAALRDVDQVVKGALKSAGEKRVAVHFHDTYGVALANSLRSYELGVRTIDSSAGGLGGCPFAPGATGNLATEDLVFLLNGMGVRTGVDLDQLARLSLEFHRRIGKPIVSRYLQAYLSRRLV